MRNMVEGVGATIQKSQQTATAIRRRQTTMDEILWRSPAPSSGFHRGVTVHLKPRREIVLSFEFEDAGGVMRTGELVFRNVVQYCTTYLAALRADMINQAYDRVVDVGKSSRLHEVTSAMQANGDSTEVRHYLICFDDGPCFEFIAEEFDASTS